MIGSTKVNNFVDVLLGDLLPRVAVYSSHFHTGGDEVSKDAYLLDDTVRSNDTNVLRPLLQQFVDRVHAQVREMSLTPVVWEEMLLDWNLTLPNNTIVQTWLSDASVAETVSKGYRTLAGNYNFWYLDCGQGQWLDFYPGADSASFWPYADYCSPR